jgi:hypothetical protein
MPSNKLPISLRYYFRTDMLMLLVGAFIWRNYANRSLGVGYLVWKVPLLHTTAATPSHENEKSLITTSN